MKTDEDFEETLWSKILEESSITTIIGGEFNLAESEVDERLANSSYHRVPFMGGSTTFLKDHHGRTISRTE